MQLRDKATRIHLLVSIHACFWVLLRKNDFSCVLHDSPPCFIFPSFGGLVHWLVGWSVPFFLCWRLWAFWAQSSCPNALMTFSITFPAYLHTSRVAVYLALFQILLLQKSRVVHLLMSQWGFRRLLLLKSISAKFLLGSLFIKWLKKHQFDHVILCIYLVNNYNCPNYLHMLLKRYFEKRWCIFVLPNYFTTIF